MLHINFLKSKKNRQKNLAAINNLKYIMMNVSVSMYYSRF